MHRIFFPFAGIASLILLCPPAAGQAQPAASKQAASQPAAQVGSLGKLPILRGSLPNGLRVVLSPDRSIPTVAIAVYYDVGSRNEQRGYSGFAHLFEHMMFQGSANVGKGDHFSLIMNRGGTLNGTTSVDRTNYFETLPSSELDLGLWLEADRMRSLAVTAKNFENQRQTVMEERRQSYDNQPYMTSMLRINELAYGSYWPYAHSTIGDMKDLQRAPLTAVQSFYREHYGPNNAVLSIAGDFDAAKAMERIRHYFGDVPRIQVRPFKPGERSVQKAERVESMVDDKAQLPAFHLAYPILPSRQPDHYPLELLASMLGGGQSSLLYQKLVKELQLCQQIDVDTDDRRGPDLFSVWAVMAQGKSISEARRVIDETIATIQQKGIEARELEKARNGVRSAFVFGLQSNLSRAMHFAEFELYWGDANLIRGELERYVAVQEADIQRVAQTYLVVDRRTVLDVLPKEKK